MTSQSLKENNHPHIWIQDMKIVDYLMIGATIRIGREILCLPYAGFFLNVLKPKLVSIFLLCITIHNQTQKNETNPHILYTLYKSLIIALSWIEKR